MNKKTLVLQQENSIEQAIESIIGDYGRQDKWVLKDNAFKQFDYHNKGLPNAILDFSTFNNYVKNEVKYNIILRLVEKDLSISSLKNTYNTVLSILAQFLSRYYPNIKSFSELEFDKSWIKWSTFLLDKGYRLNKNGTPSNAYSSMFRKLHFFSTQLNDKRDEFDKDVWDFRKIDKSKILISAVKYCLRFSEIPEEFKQSVKNFIKTKIFYTSMGYCEALINFLSRFLCFINEIHPEWKELKELSRNDIEKFIAATTAYANSKESRHIYRNTITSVRMYLEYLQFAGTLQAPLNPVPSLIFREDISPFIHRSRENDDAEIKYIPDDVLQQLDDNIQHMYPERFIPILIVIRATGFRIIDVLNLRYDKCLEHTNSGWYIVGDISKTKVFNHRVPITDEVASIVQKQIKSVKSVSSEQTNPEKYLFLNLKGSRQGYPPSSRAFSNALGRLAKLRNITDKYGEIFHFRNHSFRHTKGVELINNGMNLVHVQKWMAHYSPEMTLKYARILDDTMRKSWEEATKQGLFRINGSGKPIRIDVSDIENEDIIEWEYIRHNLDAVRMPLGYCMKPKKQECHTQLNPCLTCRNLCTTPDFIHQYEVEIQETKSVIERGKTQKRSVWVDKNQALLDRYEAILTVLKDGKTHHRAGKKGREYVGEERCHE